MGQVWLGSSHRVGDSCGENEAEEPGAHEEEDARMGEEGHAKRGGRPAGGGLALDCRDDVEHDVKLA